MTLASKETHDLRAGANRLGVRLGDGQIEALGAFLSLLYEWNANVNLTSIPREEALSLHILDSLSLGAVLPVGEFKTLLDVGTGAGLPGLPLKIAYPALSVTLMESSGKRLDFLAAVVQALSLKGVTLINSRAETAAHRPEFREKFELVAARAVAHLEPLSEMLLPFASVSGVAAAYKGAKAEEEVKAAAGLIESLGGTVEKAAEVPLPALESRRLVLIRKLSSTPDRYPRSSQYLARVIKRTGAAPNGE